MLISTRSSTAPHHRIYRLHPLPSPSLPRITRDLEKRHPYRAALLRENSPHRYIPFPSEAEGETSKRPFVCHVAHLDFEPYPPSEPVFACRSESQECHERPRTMSRYLFRRAATNACIYIYIYIYKIKFCSLEGTWAAQPCRDPSLLSALSLSLPQWAAYRAEGLQEACL
jgi:hypothetical protein